MRETPSQERGEGKAFASRSEYQSCSGLDRTYVGGIERGERNVSLMNLAKIAKALRVSLSELFQGV
jgi:transcriptional regulator with XRE-family HTH domain